MLHRQPATSPLVAGSSYSAPTPRHRMRRSSGVRAQRRVSSRLHWLPRRLMYYFVPKRCRASGSFPIAHRPLRADFPSDSGRSPLHYAAGSGAVVGIDAPLILLAPSATTAMTFRCSAVAAQFNGSCASSGPWPFYGMSGEPSKARWRSRPSTPSYRLEYAHVALGWWR